MTSQQTQFFEDDFKELDRILQIAKTPQDWDYADMLYMYLIGKIDRLSFSPTPYEINTYEQSVLDKYKKKQQQKEQEKQQQKRERIAQISPFFEALFIGLFIAFQIWIVFQYAKNIETTLVLVGAWLFSFYAVYLIRYLTINSKIKEGFIGIFILLSFFTIPALNIFIFHLYTPNIGTTILHYFIWITSFIIFTMFKYIQDKTTKIERNSKHFFLFLMAPSLTLCIALCILAYYLRPV